LINEPDLHEYLSRTRPAVPPGSMGLDSEIVLAATGASVTGALVRSLTVWLRQLRSDVTIEVTGPDGSKVSFSGKRVRNPKALLDAVLEGPARSGSGPTGDSGNR